MFKDISGQKFNHLTAIKRIGTHTTKSGHKSSIWLFECDCENKTLIEKEARYVINGQIKSCGCYKIKKKNHKTNKYDLTGEYGIGWTTNTNKEFYFDLEDYDLIKNHAWSECQGKKIHYSKLVASVNGKKTTMAILLGFKWHDHINRNPLDNRKSNLRPTSHKTNNINKNIQQNNKTGVSGVWWYKNYSKWTASVRVNGKQKNLGYFENFDDAVKARLQAEKEYYGEFAPQQHLFKQYSII